MTDAAAGEDRSFLPALRWRRLTPLFDQVVRVTTRERRFKRRLLELADVSPADRVLDLGAGTGTLAIRLKERCPEARVTGLDADAEILGRAREKAQGAGAEIDFVEGFSTDLPFADQHFDVVLSSLFFHHLSATTKRATLTEIVRVLKPGGRLYVADWGRPSDPLMSGLFLLVRAFDGFDSTRDNVQGRLPELFSAAGLRDAGLREELRTMLGTLALYSARNPD